MKIFEKNFYITLISVSTVLIAGAIFCTSNKIAAFSKVNAEKTLVLDSSNSPTLSGGEGTMQDEKNVTWEYHNAADYASGHVSLTHQGYFGVSHSSMYGISGISEVVVTFNAGSDGELWLLSSVDGINWGEVEMLKDPTETSKTSAATTSVNNWRYIRFYYYDSNSGSIDIDDVSISYSCTGISATEDVDSAKASNVIETSSNLTYVDEYYDISPNSIGGEAVSFTKLDSSNTWINIGFGKTYKVGPTQNAKVEFDMKTSNINYGKYIQLMKNNTTLGSAIYSDKSSAYKCTNISGDWYHIELPITTVVSTISGIIVNGETKDKPHSDILNKEFNGIKINAGTCIIDNLRLTSSPCELGIFNNTTYKPSVNEFFWLKVAWVGKLYPEQVTMTFSDDTLARHIPITYENLLFGSPFYIQLLDKGTLTVTCSVVSGYNRVAQTIQHTIVIN